MTLRRNFETAGRLPQGRPLLLWAAAMTAAATVTLSGCGPTSPAAEGPTTPAVGAVAAVSPTAEASSPSAAAVTPTPTTATSSKAAAGVKPAKAKAKAHTSGGSSSKGSGSGATVPVSADAPQAVKAAFQQARADGRNVLLDFGSTTCFACRTVHALYSDPSIKAEINAHYHLVEIDIDSNMSLLQKYDNSGSYGLPVLLVVSPSGTIKVDTNKTGHPQLNKSGFLNWLTQWAK
ncbi:thioredoxin family protein [Streptacidiphilus rugosus]|uniref:thioredoxin family protein n=1 Tax=Streptacidiphilus rugosus TaxID=405783 RepID=UPI0005615172|nr:thioredoxin family protein [Streptacidiphilus rugosus]